MNRNIEIKAKASDWKNQIKLARKLGRGPWILNQEDIFFSCPNGRLKLRRINKKEDQLILYRRADQEGPKTSSYTVLKIKNYSETARFLASAFGELQTVLKKRQLFLAGQTRIHFDEVKGLGRFIELEVVLKPKQSVAEGEKIAKKLMADLNIAPQDLLKGAYADMLQKKKILSLIK